MTITKQYKSLSDIDFAVKAKKVGNKSMASITKYINQCNHHCYKQLSSIVLSSKRLFSEIQDYDEACSSYDRMRRAVAVDKIDNTLQLMYSRDYIPISTCFNNNTMNTLGNSYTFDHFKQDLCVLDAGCGTGNYIKALYDLGVGCIHGMDISEGMLSKCVEKFKNIDTNVLNSQSIKLLPGDLNEAFPYKSKMFDVVLLTQVLHHVVNNEYDEDLENIDIVIKNCYNLLNEGSALIITTSTPGQLKYGYWFAKFFPRAIDEMIEKHGDLEWWFNKLRQCGFDDIHSYRIMDFHATTDYLNINGIFDDEWRKCDSLFGLITDLELKTAQHQIRKILSDKNKKNQFLTECEELRENFGHSMALIAFKN